jgi:hypothetical protein
MCAARTQERNRQRHELVVPAENADLRIAGIGLDARPWFTGRLLQLSILLVLRWLSAARRRDPGFEVRSVRRLF